MVDEEETEFHEEYVNEEDPSILRFLLAAGDEVSSKQLRDDLMTMLIAGHETSAAVLTWTTYLLSQVTTQLPLLLSLFFQICRPAHMKLELERCPVIPGLDSDIYPPRSGVEIVPQFWLLQAARKGTR